MKISKTGSVRVDLLGGTLDIHPINLVLKDVVTLNMATNLLACASIESLDEDSVIFHSSDYNVTKRFSLEQLNNIDSYLSDFGPFEFVARIVHFFLPTGGLKISLSSGAPPGSGLGGSSAMGAVLFSACADYFDLSFEREKIVQVVQNIESKILNAGPAGYQDYYPSLFGGVLALESEVAGVQVKQLFSSDLSNFLEDNIRLIFSGESRQSGINNWEVYKGFFDGNELIREGLENISQITQAAYKCILSKDFNGLLQYVAEEGSIRETLFPTILTENMKQFKDDLLKLDSSVGMKVCGAGGGGCFIITGASKLDLTDILRKYSMKELAFSVHQPKGDA